MSDQRQIIRSSAIIGGSSFANIIISLVRTKVVALLLGPSGIGLIGLFNGLIAAGSTVAALGFGNVGVRQISDAVGQSDPKHLETVRRALFVGTLVLAIIGGAVFWLLRDLLATFVLKNQDFGSQVGWLAIAVSLNVLAGSQVALLNGLRRIADLARLSIFSALLASILGIPILLIWKEHGVVAYLLLSSIATLIVGYFYVAKIPKLIYPRPPFSAFVAQWGSLARLGSAITITAAVSSVGHLAVRGLVQADLGYEALGNFEAAWVISMTYIGFVLKAMGTDYYPNLTSSIRDRLAVKRLVNQQAEISFLMAGPVLLVMIALAPWVIQLLYSSQFDTAASVLRWQVFGDIFKLASFPLAYIILAEGNGKKFMLVEISATIVFVASVWIGLPYSGLNTTGFSFVLMYLFHFLVVYFLAYKKFQFFWSVEVFSVFLFLLVSASIAMIASYIDLYLGAFVGVFLSFIFSVKSYKRISSLARVGLNDYLVIFEKFKKLIWRYKR
jgi:O-antigen/teichoic acid export membrane protein